MIVKKFGGASVDSPEKIKNIAQKLKADLTTEGSCLVVVSAMGSTTNQLIQLAKQIAPYPSLRELDMLLTTGERISAALLSIALADIGVRATSLTGSQAGLVTNETHANAFITDVRPHRIDALFKTNDIVVLAGFQGVSEVTKNITTLGRGGSDTTAIAMAAKLGASCCQILKEVPAVLSADPRLVTGAKIIHELTYEQATEMTFWGAKVLHHRSAQLAARHQVPVYVGPAHSQAQGTWIRQPKETPMFETPKFVAINSHASVLHVISKNPLLMTQALGLLKTDWSSHKVIEPQILWLEQVNEQTHVYLTGSDESLQTIAQSLDQNPKWDLQNKALSSVSILCYPTSSIELQQRLFECLGAAKIDIQKVLISGQSIHLLVDQKNRSFIMEQIHKDLIVDQA